jgi:hypothetical protein
VRTAGETFLGLRQDDDVLFNQALESIRVFPRELCGGSADDRAETPDF